MLTRNLDRTAPWQVFPHTEPSSTNRGGNFVHADLLSTHLQVNRYGRFTLTDAIRPSPNLAILPRQGYRLDVYRDQRARLRLGMLSASVSAERLFDVFLALLEPLGEMVHVVLESSHGAGSEQQVEFRRNEIDAPVVASHFCDFEDLLVNDGCTGVAVLSAAGPVEVQFDEHKLLYVYAADVRPFRQILKRFGVRRRKAMPLISEGEHLHHSTDDYADRFRELCCRTGADDCDRVFSDEGMI